MGGSLSTTTKRESRHRMHNSACAVYMPIFYTLYFHSLAAVSYFSKLTAKNVAELSIGGRVTMVTLQIPPKNDKAAVWNHGRIIRQNNIKVTNQKGILQYKTTTKSAYK